MNKFATLLATTAAMSLAAPAFAADKTDVKAESSYERGDNGGYTKTTSSEKSTPTGSARSEVETELNVDDDGDAEKTTTTKEVNDPKGLWNKDTVKTQTTEKVKDGKLTVEHEKTVNGKTVSDHKSAY